MKKQLLILILAIFAVGISSTAFGQVAPRPVTCLTADHLHPIPGQPYTYQVSVPNVTDPTFTWFVTQNQNFIQIVGGIPQLNYTVALGAEPQTGGLLMDAGTGYATPPAGSTNNSIEITWKSFAYNPLEPVFVVVQAIGNNGLCTPNNLKVYRIEPLFAFTLDIDNLNSDGTNHTVGTYGDNLNVCISDIQSAVYDAANDAIAYDFGVDTLYYEVVAANWYDRWQLGVQISGIVDAQGQTAQIDWAYAPVPRPTSVNWLETLTWYEVVASALNDTPHTSSTLVSPQNGTTAVDELGESIFIRVIVDHGTQYQGITDLPITIAVNGVIAPNDGSGNYVVGDPLVVGDIHTTDDGGTPPTCPYFDMYANDISLQTILRRPEVTSVAPVPNPPTTPVDGYLPIAP